MTNAERTLDSLTPYPAYDSTRLSLVPLVPSGWEVRALQSLCSVKARLGWKALKADEYVPDGFVFLATPNIKGASIDFENVNYISEFRYLESPEIALEEDDVLLAKDGSTLGIVNVVTHLPRPSTVNSSIAVLRTIKNSMRGDFLRYLLSSHLMQAEIEKVKGGMGVPHLFQSDIKKFALLVPPIEDQAAIAAFLDHETARIDELVREQEQLLEDLAVKRRATVNHATHAAIPLAPSALPQGWRNVTLKSLLTSFEQGWSPQCDNRPAIEGEWGVMKVGCVNGDVFNPQENKALPADLDPIQRYSLKADDVLISRANTRDLVGSAARVDRDYPQLLLCDKLYRLRTAADQLRPGYLVLLLNSPIARAAIETAASGASASMVNISQSTIRNLVFPIPPLHEQDEIIAHLDECLAQIDKLVEEVRANIDDMKLLRLTLITAATTGKIDVRDWQPA